MPGPRRSRSRRAILTLLATVAIAAIVAGCRPAIGNGRIPPTGLVRISGTCYVVREVAGGLVQMLIDANKAGIKLAPEKHAYLPPGTPNPPRVESCYRSLEMQQWWRDYYCSIGSCGLAAVPGTSRHGWGKAVDFEQDGHELFFDSPGYAWLKANAWKYGFRHPDWAEPGQSSAEPWHWEAG